jgi:hypothetical protein
MNWIEFLIAGVILILILFFVFELFQWRMGARVCSMACREFRNSYYHKFDYESLSCECCNLVNGSLICQSIWKK